MVILLKSHYNQFFIVGYSQKYYRLLTSVNTVAIIFGTLVLVVLYMKYPCYLNVSKTLKYARMTSITLLH